MNLPDAIQILKLHNEWRKGAEAEQQDPASIGQAINELIAKVSEPRMKTFVFTPINETWDESFTVVAASEQTAIELLDNWFSSYGDKFPIDDYGCDEVFPNAILVH